MAYSGLAAFIAELSKRNELRVIREYVNPVLEIAEITDRITKSGGQGLAFCKYRDQLSAAYKCLRIR